MGWHWLENHHFDFSDIVTNQPVYYAQCPCGKVFLTDSLNPLFGFRNETKIR